MAKRASRRWGFYRAVKTRRRRYNPQNITRLLDQINEARVNTLADSVAAYIVTNLPKAIENRGGLSDYRSNPYVLMTTASLMNLSNPTQFADFLFNNKLYMGLETSFGKSIEAPFVAPYPVNVVTERKWQDAPEKIAESEALRGLSNEEKARRRARSVWREIDKSCVVGDKRYLVTIKSGPNCINDTQVSAMTNAIAQNHVRWMEHTRANYPEIEELDIVIGITYGTDRTTNNKENQILVKLLEHGFEEESRDRAPGVLIDSATRRVRVYRKIGQDFWGFIGDPTNPENAMYVYLEVLLGLAKALSQGMEDACIEDRINRKIRQLSEALSCMVFPRNSLPVWVREDFTEDELFWFAASITAFFDEGI